MLKRTIIYLFSFFIILGCTQDNTSTTGQQPIEKKINTISVSEMVLIPEGDFLFGKENNKVSLKSYYIDKFTVTNEEYKYFVEITGHKAPMVWNFTGYDDTKKDHPVVYVNYSDAESFCKWANKRLLTAPEWEKAARGTDGRKYPWGNKFDRTKTNTSVTGVVTTLPVNSHPEGKSPYGIYNMAGNVWEWTNTNGQNDKRKVVKGGSWGLSHRFSLTFNQIDYGKKDKTNNIGFRCGKELENK